MDGKTKGKSVVFCKEEVMPKIGKGMSAVVVPSQASARYHILPRESDVIITPQVLNSGDFVTVPVCRVESAVSDDKLKNEEIIEMMYTKAGIHPAQSEDKGRRRIDEKCGKIVL